MFKYKVKFWDEDEKKNVIEVGLIGVEKWSKAAKELEEYYGKDNICSIELTPLSTVLYAEECIELMQEALADE